MSSKYNELLKGVGDGYSPVSIADPLLRNKPEKNTSYIGDVVDSVQAGAIGGFADLAQGATLGYENPVSTGLRDWADSQYDTMQDSSVQAMQNTGFNDDGSLKDDSSWAGAGLLAGQGVGSLASFMVPGGLAAKGAAKILPGVSKGVTQAVGYGTTGGALMGGGGANQAADEVRNADPALLAEAKGFQERYNALLDKGTAPDAAFAEAKEQFAQEVGQGAFAKNAAVGLVSMGLTGPLFEKVLRGAAAGGRIRNAAVGAGTEAAQELTESGSQQYLANQAAIENFDPLRDPMEGVVGQALTGAAIGAGVGGGIGAITGRKRTLEESVGESMRGGSSLKDAAKNALNEQRANLLDPGGNTGQTKGETRRNKAKVGETPAAAANNQQVTGDKQAKAGESPRKNGSTFDDERIASLWGKLEKSATQETVDEFKAAFPEWYAANVAEADKAADESKPMTAVQRQKAKRKAKAVDAGSQKAEDSQEIPSDKPQDKKPEPKQADVGAEIPAPESLPASDTDSQGGTTGEPGGTPGELQGNQREPVQNEQQAQTEAAQETADEATGVAPEPVESKPDQETVGTEPPLVTETFTPTHELPDGTPVRKVDGDEENVYADAAGDEYIDDDATPVKAKATGGQSSPENEKEAASLPPIVTQPKNKYLKAQVKAAKIKKNSPGYADAVAGIEKQYESDLDKAYAEMPFDQYNRLNPNTPASVNKQAHEQLREEFGVTESEATPDTQPVDATPSEPKQESGAAPSAKAGTTPLDHKWAAGESGKTNTGRATTPFPKVSKRFHKGDQRKLDQWLIDNAIAEAEARGDDFNKTGFSGEQAGNLPPASKDAINEYLFGDTIHQVVPKIGKPLASNRPTEGQNSETGTKQDKKAKASKPSEADNTAAEAVPKPKRQYHPGIETMANELTENGGMGYTYDQNDKVSGRTASINPEWYKDGAFTVMNVKGDAPLTTTPSVKRVKAAVRRHAEGKPLTKAQERILEALDDIVTNNETDARLEHESDIDDTLKSEPKLDEMDDAAFSDAIANGDIDLNEILSITTHGQLKAYIEYAKQKDLPDEQNETATTPGDTGHAGRKSDGGDKETASQAPEAGLELETQSEEDLAQREQAQKDRKAEEQKAKSQKVISPKKVEPAMEKASQQKAESAPSEIEDFGDKLHGARKDLARSLSRDISDEDYSALPLSKLWPKKEIDAIEDKALAAFAFAARQEIPAKPRKSYKVERWVEKVKSMRSLLMEMLDSDNRNAFLKQMHDSDVLSIKSFASKAKFLQEIEQDQWSRIGQVSAYPDSYYFDKDGAKKKAAAVYVEIDGRRKSYKGGSLPEVSDQIKKDLQGVAAKSGPQIKFEIRVSRKTGKPYINKVGDPEYRPLKEFDDVKAARKFLRDKTDVKQSEKNYAELVSLWEQVKERDNVKKADVRGKDNRPRTGKKRRDGDVTSKQFQDVFGFRGVEFGNWVKQGKNAKDRQGMINQAYDALMDLADIVGVPPKAISLNGTLGLGFGSRGSGSASAHYEPGNIVINLTKTKGAGTLAHEWFHALDNYFSRQRGGEVPMSEARTPDSYREQNFITYRPEPMYVHKSGRSSLSKIALEGSQKKHPDNEFYKQANWQPDPNHPKGVRPEVEVRFAELVTALDLSPMKKRASIIDKGRNGYWSRIIERAARSFENYVITKMDQGGYNNDYLANVVSGEEFERNPGRYPYLLSSEIAPIEKAFDDLFSTIKTKETDQGLAVYEPGQKYSSVLESDNEVQETPDAKSARTDQPGEGHQWDLFATSGIPGATARSQLADTYHVAYKQVEVGQLSAAFDTVTSSEQVAHVVAPIRKHAQETFLAVVTDDKGKILNVIRHSKGAKDSSNVDPVEVAAAIAATENGTRVWFAHNHPAGMSDPSASDFRITNQLEKTLVGSGINISGHVVVGSNGNFHYFMPGMEVAQPGVATPAPRGKKVALTERMLRKANHSQLAPITDPGSAIKVVSELDSDSGIVLLNNKNIPVGVLAISPSEMAKLKQGGRVRRILRALDKTNANGGIVFVPLGSEQAGNNLGNYLSNLNGFSHLDTFIKPDDGKVTSLASLQIPLSDGKDFHSRSGKRGASTKADIEKALERPINRLTKAIKQKVEVVQSTSDLPIDVPDDVRGMYYDGAAYVVADNVPTNEAKTVLTHELIGHLGLETMLGREGFADLLGQIKRMKRNRNKAVAGIVAELKKNYVNADGNYVLDADQEAREILAHMAEGDTKHSLVKKIIAKVRMWLAKMGLGNKDEAFIRDVIAKAARFVEGKDGGVAIDSKGNLVPAYAIAFHGTPHKFDKFNTEAIGTGEGAQAYGHGLYFAGKREVAEYYKDTLSRYMSDASKVAGDEGVTLSSAAKAVVMEYANKQLESEHAARRAQYANVELRKVPEDALKRIIQGVRTQIEGNLYQVELAPKESEYLLWDKPLSEQSENVSSAVKAIDNEVVKAWVENGAWEKVSGETLYRHLAGGLTVGAAKEGKHKDASEYLHSLGIRGIKYLDGTSRGEGEGHYNYVLFSDDDVTITHKNDQAMFSRKATETAAEHDTEQAVLEKLGMAPAKATSLRDKLSDLKQKNWRQTIDSLKARSQEGLFDGLAGLKQAEDATGTGIARGDFSGSAYVGARLATGVADMMTHVLHYGAIKWADGVPQGVEGTNGLMKIMGDLGEDADNFLMWMAGHRAEELMAQGRENNLTEDEITFLKGKGNGKEEAFLKAKLDYNRMNSAMLDFAEEAGLIDPDSRDKWESEWYIPFYRQQEGEILAPHTKRGLSHQTSGIKALSGSDKPTADLLENMLTNWMKLVDASVKNMALTKMVDNLGDSDYLTNESMKYTKAIVPKTEIAKRIEQDREFAKYVAEYLGMNETASNMEIISEMRELDKEGFDELWAITEPSDPNVIRVKRANKNEYYRVNDESLLRATGHLAFQGFNDPVTRTGRWFKRLLTTGVTASPDFMLRNFIRDAAHAWAINKDGFAFGKDSMTGLKDAMQESGVHRMMMAGGASFQGGYVHGTDPEATAQIMRRELEKQGLTRDQINAHMGDIVDTPAKLAGAMQRAWQKYRSFGDKVENANRIATAKAAIDAGKPVAQVLYESKDLMDYSMRGNFAALMYLTDMLPFLNARMVGLNKLGRAVIEDPKIVAMKVAKIAAFSVALAMLNDDDERYQELQDWNKDAYWHFWLGDEHFAIPKPFEIGIVAGTIPERMYRTWVTDSQPNEKLLWSLQHGLMETLGFNPTPQFVLPVLEVWGNKSMYFDTPIESMADKNVISSKRYNEYTSNLARAVGNTELAEWIGISPKQLQHIWKGYTGTMGGYALSAADILVRGASDHPTRQQAKLSDLPLFRSVYKGDTVRSTQYLNDFYDRMGEVEEIYRTIRELQKEGRTDEARELRTENIDKLRTRGPMKVAQKQLRSLRSRREAILRSDMDPAEKRERSQDIQRRINKVSKRIDRVTQKAFAG